MHTYFVHESKVRRGHSNPRAVVAIMLVGAMLAACMVACPFPAGAQATQCRKRVTCSEMTVNSCDTVPGCHMRYEGTCTSVDPYQLPYCVNKNEDQCNSSSRCHWETDWQSGACRGSPAACGVHSSRADCVAHQWCEWHPAPSSQSCIQLATLLDFPAIDTNNLGEEVSTATIRPLASLGVLNGRVYLQAGVDDRLDIIVNGAQACRVPYGSTSNLDLTPVLRTGRNTVTLKAFDNNRGRCWNVWYHLGDASGWKVSETIANVTCGPNLPNTIREMYSRNISFDFRP